MFLCSQVVFDSLLISLELFLLRKERKSTKNYCRSQTMSVARNEDKDKPFCKRFGPRCVALAPPFHRESFGSEKRSQGMVEIFETNRLAGQFLACLLGGLR